VLDGVQFEIVHPAAQFSGSANDGSCVLRVMARGGSALLTGDIERAAEAALAAAGSIDVDVVIAPHHGSATSSTAPFVAATSPEVTIVSAGFRNRWNFPADEVVRRWCDIGSRVLVTGEHGAVEVVFGKDSPRVAGLRRTQPRFWRRNGAPRCGESPGVTL
jgi:competence protein ComEC